MYSVASSTADITTLLSNTGTIVALVVAAVLGGAIALAGVGFAWRHIVKRITGRKF